MTGTKIHFAIDKTIKDAALQKAIFKQYKNYSPKRAKFIVVIGGDGFMLETLKKYHKYNKQFYGMNKGTFGFLMNKFKTVNMFKNIAKAKLISISPLEMKAITKTGKTFSAIALNEVSLLRQSRQTASLQIMSGNKIIKRNNDKNLSNKFFISKVVP